MTGTAKVWLAFFLGVSTHCRVSPDDMGRACRVDQDCDRYLRCVTWRGDSGVERTCELPCERDADCPSTTACTSQDHIGPAAGRSLCLSRRRASDLTQRQ